MPIYEYLCHGCQQRFEVKQSFSDPPLSTCERCGGTVTKLISAPAIMFKGSGWYITDYSDKLKPPSAGQDASTKADAKDGKSGEAKKADAPTGTGGGASSSGSGSGNGGSAGGSTPSSSSSSPSSSSSSGPSSSD